MTLGITFKEGFVYTGRYARYSRKYFGNSYADIPAQRIIVYSQNHDQVGNRKHGARLSTLVEFADLKLAACAVLFSPYVPLLFMGEEYGEKNSFRYFASHSDKELIQAVKEGRKREFGSFGWAGDMPDPQAKETFLSSKLRWENRN